MPDISFDGSSPEPTQEDISVSDSPTGAEGQPEGPALTLVEGGKAQPTDSWKQDKRFTSGMWKSEEDVYKSQREMEKKYVPVAKLQEQLKGYDSKFSDYEKKIQDYESQVQGYRPIQQFIEWLKTNPAYEQRVNESIQQIVEEEELKRHGMKLTPEVREKLSKVDDFERKFQEIEQEKQTQANLTLLTEKMTEISAFTKSHDINFGTEKQAEFLKYIQDHKIPIEYADAAFYKVAMPQIMAMNQQKGKDAVIKNLQKGKAAALPSSRGPIKSNQQTSSKPTLKDRDTAYTDAIVKSLGL